MPAYGQYPGVQLPQYGYTPPSPYAPVFQPTPLPSLPQMQPQMQPQLQQTQPVQAQQQPVTVRMVASRAEAYAAQIPFDGTINVFVNANAREVYIKRFNPETGGADFGDYLRQNAPAQQAAADAAPCAEYATTAALEETRAKLAALAKEMDALRAAIGKKTRKGATEDE